MNCGCGVSTTASGCAAGASGAGADSGAISTEATVTSGEASNSGVTASGKGSAGSAIKGSIFSSSFAEAAVPYSATIGGAGTITDVSKAADGVFTAKWLGLGAGAFE